MAHRVTPPSSRSSNRPPRARRRVRLAAQCLVAAALLAGWGAVVYANRPAACFLRAERALDADDAEPLQYALLGLRDAPAYEPHAGLLTARLLLGEGRPDPALIVLETAAAHRDTELRALNLAGEALYRMGRLREAGELWTSVIQREPDNVAAQRWLGIAYYDLGAMKEAVRHLARAAALSPGDAGSQRLLGLIWKGLGKHSEAAEAFQESLRRNPTQGDALAVRYEIAECLHYSRRNEEALDVLRDCEPVADILALRARCEHASGRGEEAEATARKTLQLNDRHIGALLLLATIANEQKRPADAVARWRRVVEIDPSNREAHYQLAIAYRRAGHADDAEQQRRAADELSQLQEEQQRALEVAATAPDDVEVRIKLGTLCERLRRYKDAREWFRAAIYLDPENQPAKEALLRLLKLKNSQDRAN